VAVVHIVEDEKLLRWALGEKLKRAGHTVEPAGDLAEASQVLARQQPEVMLLDISLPDGNGLDFYENNLTQLEDTVVIVMTAAGQIEDAVRAMKLGALDFLTKPVEHDEMIALVNRSIAVRSDNLEAHAARQSRERELGQKLVGESPAFCKVLDLAKDVAQSKVESILIQGETGSGKNVLARQIHALSDRRQKPILEVSCAAIPEQLLESELLGHERGAFTDARATRRGAFELANGGTLVLDEIGELKIELQAKLLHVLEERRMRRVGGEREIVVDVRVIALTIRDLATMVREGTFRQDLFYRLNIFPITVPSLRERGADILPLATHHLKSLQAKFGRHFKGFTREAENQLLCYPWPGNVRELRNVIERAMILERSDRIQAGALILDSLGQDPGTLTVEGAAAPTAPMAPRTPVAPLAPRTPLGIVPLEQVEREMVARAMVATDGNQTRAAQLLGISRDQLRYRLKKDADPSKTGE
jgi:two-component system response regulator AtoC